MGIKKTLLAGILASMGTAGSLTFGVTLSNVVGGNPSSGTGIVTINPVAAPNVIVPVITASRTTGVAPLAITFDALQTTAPVLTALPFSEIHYEWRFGDDRGTFWSYGTNVGGNNKNIAFGPVAAHVFETPGTFTVELIASHINNAGQLSQTTVTLPNIVVTNADTVFPGTNTICISQNSRPVAGVGGAPAGCAVQQVASWSTVQTLAQTYKRILLKRGDVWPNEGSITIGASQAGTGLIGAYGTGDRPVITNGSIRIETADWRVVDIYITGASQAERTWSSGLNTRPGCVDALFLRTDVRWCWNPSNFENSTGVYVVDCDLGDVSDQVDHGYANWTGNVSRIAFLGARLHGSDAHTARWQGVDMAVCSNCTFELPKGTPLYAWSMFTIRGKVGTPTETWNGLWTEHVVVSDVYIASGAATHYASFSIAPMNDGSAERIRNVLVERVRVNSLGSEAAAFAVATGLTVRNNIFQTLHTSAVLIEAKSDTGGSPDMSQAFFYGNTLYKPNTSLHAGFSGISIPTRATGIVAMNNIAYAPGSTSPTMFGGAAVEGVNYTQSNNSSNAQVLSDRPWAAVTPVAAVDFTPSGSYAVDGGTWVPVYKNYFGTTASGTREIGAI